MKRKTMQKTALVCGLVGWAFAAQLRATPVEVWTVGNGGDHPGYGPYQTGVGGEFTLETDSAKLFSHYDPKVTSGLVTGVSGAGNFQTFCVESKEYIYAGEHDTVTFGQKTRLTGTTLDMGAAWLYYEFATGKLPGYDFKTDLLDKKTRDKDAGLLQDAIWYFMGDQEGIRYDPKHPSKYPNVFITDAYNEFGKKVCDPSRGAYGVEVMSLWHGTVGTQCAARQDQLVYIGCVPDGGVTAMLLGVGMIGLGWFRRWAK